MNRLTLAALAVATAAVAAATLASAAAPTKGRLIVVNPANRVSNLAGTTLLTTQAPNTYRTTVYVPQGYQAVNGLAMPDGKSFGNATVYVTQQDGSRATLNGTLTARNPTTTLDTANCTGVAGHDQVWMINAKQTKGTLTAKIPVYVDRVAGNGPETDFASWKLTFCATLASQLNVSEVDLGLGKVFVNPVASGMFMWRAVFDPYAPDGKSIASASSTEVASAVPINTQVTVNVARIKANARWVAFTGKVTIVNKPLGGVKVQLFVGKQKHLDLARASATVRTKADGSYRVVLRLKKGAWWVRAKASSPYRDITPGGGCQTVTPTISAGGCVDATITPFVVLNPTVRRVF